MKQRTADLGSVIRRIRTSRGMTGAELAQATQMSPSYISQVERGQIVPSVAALHQLSEALGVPTFYFFVEDDALDIVVRAGDRKVMDIQSPARYELVSPTLHRNMQLLQCTIPPGQSTMNEPFAHKGEEAVYVLKGTVELTVGDHQFTVNEGDCAQFEARLAHRYRNAGETEAVLLFAISPPM